MQNDLLSKGIYAIINKSLNRVYIGKTERNFLIRWTEHLMRIPDYQDEPSRIYLYLNESTKFIILKKMDDAHYKSSDFYRLEYEAHQFYIKKEWNILSSCHYSPHTEYHRSAESGSLIKRYRKAVKHLAHFLATVNTKHTNPSFILGSLYKKIEKEFNVDLEKREGKSSLQKLKEEELEFILLDLYPRYYQKRLNTLRSELKHIKPSVTLFDFPS